MDRGNSALETALDYLGRGWRPIPIPHRQKGPKIKGWPELRITDKNAHHYFNGVTQNVGVVLGLCSGGLADVDLDCPQALRVASALLPGTGSVFGRVGKPWSHRLYSVGTIDVETGAFQPGRCASEKLQDPIDGATLVELRGDPADPERGSLQTVFPGSTHPSGEAIEWAEDGDLAIIREPELRRQVWELGAVALLAKHWPVGPHKDANGAAAAGGRHDAGFQGRRGCVARLVGNERHGFRWSWLVGSGSEVKLGRGLGEALPAVDLAQGDLA